MPNLKIDVDALKKMVRSEGEQSQERLKNVIARCVAELQEAASAAAAMPPSAVDLVATAEVCLVAEVDTSRIGGQQRRMQVEIHLDGNRLQMASYEYERQPVIPEGRYRAIFVLVPIER
ncbi:MAG: hypothetical protein ACRD1X_22115 [Vicinamibacteria bacterium]